MLDFLNPAQTYPFLKWRKYSLLRSLNTASRNITSVLSDAASSITLIRRNTYLFTVRSRISSFLQNMIPQVFDSCVVNAIFIVFTNGVAFVHDVVYCLVDTKTYFSVYGLLSFYSFRRFDVSTFRLVHFFHPRSAEA